MVDFKKWLEVHPPEDANRRSLANSMENLLLADKRGDDDTTTKADVDERSKTIAEEEMPPLEEAQGPNIEEIAYSPT
ncbi:hypothetical protein RhiJN_27079 [Ceratobasidium sp. AG-Ba]|nr:hypothetical protein RhiJN_27079 [Ceratobasidium sp. AG-Ba]